MQYPHLRSGVFTDTHFNDTTSVRGNNCALLFVTDDGHCRIYPLPSKGQAFDKLDLYCSTVGIPLFLVSDNVGEETGSDWERVRKKSLFQQRTTEPHSPWQNRAEREIQELKRHFRRIMHRAKCPEQFWDYSIDYTLQIRERMSRHLTNERTPIEKLTGITPDVSEYLHIDYYGWVKYHDVRV